jgi:hypothetical protein
MMSVIVLSAIMVSAIMVNVVMLSVVVPMKHNSEWLDKYKHGKVLTYPYFIFIP